MMVAYLVRNSPNGHFYTLEHLRSVRELTDNSGLIQAQYSFDPFGRIFKISEIVASDFGYSRYYTHSRSGLALTINRGYSPSIGRFISFDPLFNKFRMTFAAFFVEANLFVYVRNNPISFTDPTGLSYKICCTDPTVPCPPAGRYSPSPSSDAVCAQSGGAGGTTYFLGPNKNGTGWTIYTFSDGQPEGGVYVPNPWKGPVVQCP
jgi:RHS repeat-associated protein